MSYKLYTDKTEIFECEIEVKNASIKNSFARIIVEGKNNTLVFNGRIDGKKCVVPIQKLKGTLQENDTGKMFLEVVVEDTYFKPWQSDYIVEEHTSVKVNVNEQKEVSNKPIVSIKEIKGINLYIPTKELSTICEQFGINKKNFRKNKENVSQIVNEFFNVNPEYIQEKTSILRGMVESLK